jgi:hypothetical protein
MRYVQILLGFFWYALVISSRIIPMHSHSLLIAYYSAILGIPAAMGVIHFLKLYE